MSRAWTGTLAALAAGLLAALTAGVFYVATLGAEMYGQPDMPASETPAQTVPATVKRV